MRRNELFLVPRARGAIVSLLLREEETPARVPLSASNKWNQNLLEWNSRFVAAAAADGQLRLHLADLLRPEGAFYILHVAGIKKVTIARCGFRRSTLDRPLESPRKSKVRQSQIAYLLQRLFAFGRRRRARARISRRLLI